MKQCALCSAPVVRSQRNHSRQRFCSDKCRLAHHNDRIGKGLLLLPVVERFVRDPCPVQRADARLDLELMVKGWSD